MTIEADNTKEMPTGVAHAHQAAETVVAQAVANHKKTGEDIIGPQLILSVLTELTAEDLHQLSLYHFVSRRYDDLPPREDINQQEGALRDLVGYKSSRSRLGDQGLAEKYMKLTVDAITAIIDRLLREQLQ